MNLDNRVDQNPEPPQAPSLRRIRGWMNAQIPARTVLKTERNERTTFHVPSETRAGIIYDVFVDEDGRWLCPCPDWAAWRKPCKHVFEVLDRFCPALAPPKPAHVPKEQGWYNGARRFPVVEYQYDEGLAESTRRDKALEEQDDRVESFAARPRIGHER